MKIFIDPGHGGYDPGAVGNGLEEKDIVLSIALIEEQLFLARGQQVKMSRDRNVAVSLSQRVNEANSWGADVFIANHINAGGGIGEEVWCSIYGGMGRIYATKVEKNLSEIFKSRGVKTKQGSNGDYFYVIRETTMPAILVESGFIDNAEDAKKLKDPDIIQKCAEAVVNGILDEIDEGDVTLVPFTRYLRYTQPNMVGNDIKQVQAKLTLIGINPGPIDTYYGPKTKDGVLAYQKANGLLVDGVVGPETWNSLFN